MPSYQDLIAIGERFEAFASRGLPAEIETVRTAQALLSRADALSAETHQRAAAIQGRYHLLAAGEMWCPDCQLNLAAIDHLQHLQPQVGLAIISKARAEQALKTPLKLERISIPLVLVLDDEFELIGRFVEQPQAVVEGGEAVKADYRAGRYLASTLTDLLSIIEAHESLVSTRGFSALRGDP
ncbi:thioredoxin family protein [Pseudomonas sp. PA15(2017)]|uniref:thioredoxin family protein n=1 Tax=Pseudomonas sp. PA15(2017) TaxID=1932111 RepID=UPI00095D5DE7|nr:thioredoxin family protein [Pseudomonas sp. PA15(2017)]OLU22234.1 thioredoxin family protein [Pseudomonas sp. PA15(2017)]